LLDDWLQDVRYDTTRYDTIQEFNVDLKAESGQFNLAHATKKYEKKKLKQTNSSTHL